MESTRLTDMVLALLLYDTDSAKLIRNVLDLDWLESSVHRKLAEAAYGFVDTYKQAPGTHDLDLLTSFDEAEAVMARMVLGTLRDQYAAGINKKYVLDNLEQYTRGKQIDKALTDALSERQAGRTDDAENVLTQALRKRFSFFAPGVFLQDYPTLDFGVLDDEQILLGIDAMDSFGQVPHRKEMYLFIAPAKRGKSWFMTHVGKCAIMQRWKVLHLTLEMSEHRVIRRYVQALTAATTRPQQIVVSTVTKDDLGRIMSLESRPVAQRPDLSDTQVVNERLNRLPLGKRLLIKAFPTATLTLEGLRAYLNALETSTGFVPDAIILDYADLMALPGRNDYRIELGNLYRELRGLAVERNVALITASQSNREGAKKGTLKDTEVAEDWSKIGTADVAVTYNQTASEHALGVARLFLSNGRNDADKFEVLITQSYAMGQFVLDSARVPADYQTILNQTPLPQE